MLSYVWEHLDIGYMQGMCDLVAPLLVIFNEEAITYACFCHLMERMGDNFPSGGAMDAHFANMRSLIQILDSEMFELMHQNGDYTHFYFCYRWFLLDFKRGLCCMQLSERGEYMKLSCQFSYCCQSWYTTMSSSFGKRYGQPNTSLLRILSSSLLLP